MLGLSRAGLLKRFEAALQREGCVHTLSSAKMRLDRVLNPRLRRPATEPTLMALASALEWSFPQLEAELQLTEASNGERVLGPKPNGHAPRRRAMTAREIAFALLLLFQTLPIVQAEKISAHDLARTFKAVRGTWKRGAELLEQWPADGNERDPIMRSIRGALQTMLHDTLQPLLARYSKRSPLSGRPALWTNESSTSATSGQGAFVRELARTTRDLRGNTRKLQKLLLDS